MTRPEPVPATAVTSTVTEGTPVRNRRPYDSAEGAASSSQSMQLLAAIHLAVRTS